MKLFDREALAKFFSRRGAGSPALRPPLFPSSCSEARRRVIGTQNLRASAPPRESFFTPYIQRFPGGSKPLAALCLAIFLLAGSPLARGNDGRAEGDASPSASTPAFNVPIPVNHDARGVKLPYFDIRGKLEMYFNIETAFRVDLGHLQMKNAYMQTFDDRQAPDANVFMSLSVLDLNTRIVTSDVPVTVRRSDFQIVGQKMVFNTQTHVGRMTGHVRMVIYNTQDMAGASPGPTAPASPGSTPRPGATPQ